MANPAVIELDDLSDVLKSSMVGSLGPIGSNGLSCVPPMWLSHGGLVPAPSQVLADRQAVPCSPGMSTASDSVATSAAFSADEMATFQDTRDEKDMRPPRWKRGKRGGRLRANRGAEVKDFRWLSFEPSIFAVGRPTS
mmetsp:Transcript_101806/g.255230  ORF Transcript_101806/g.255230 Transcript_101806/m.255230 type:complete len:138 (+) Transcript_101806:106-519(+)